MQSSGLQIAWSYVTTNCCSAVMTSHLLHVQGCNSLWCMTLDASRSEWGIFVLKLHRQSTGLQCSKPLPSCSTGGDPAA